MTESQIKELQSLPEIKDPIVESRVDIHELITSKKRFYPKLVLGKVTSSYIIEKTKVAIKNPPDKEQGFIYEMMIPEKRITKYNYFPLKKGNTWVYERTIMKPPFLSASAILTDDTIKFSEGTTLFSIRRSGLIDKLLKKGKESYTIIEEDTSTKDKKQKLYHVRVKGNNPRDGRYTSFGKKNIVYWEPPVRGFGFGREFFEGNITLGYKRRDKSIPTNRKTEIETDYIVLSPEEVVSPFMEKDECYKATYCIQDTSTINVPAGNFANCLKNITIVSGHHVKTFIPDSLERRNF